MEVGTSWWRPHFFRYELDKLDELDELDELDKRTKD